MDLIWEEGAVYQVLHSKEKSICTKEGTLRTFIYHCYVSLVYTETEEAGEDPASKKRENRDGGTIHLTKAPIAGEAMFSVGEASQKSNSTIEGVRFVLRPVHLTSQVQSSFLYLDKQIPDVLSRVTCFHNQKRLI